MVGAHHAVFRADGAAFDQRQQIALHAFPRHVGAVRLRPPRNLVDLIDEHDAVFLDCTHGLQLHVLLIDELAGFVLRKLLQRILNLKLSALRAAFAHVLKHALELLRHLFHARWCHDLDADRLGHDVHFDVAVVELAFAQHFAEPLARLAALLAHAR